MFMRTLLVLMATVPLVATAVEPQISASNLTYLLKQDGTAWQVGNHAMQTTRTLAAYSDVVAVNADGGYALRSNGELWTQCCGAAAIVLSQVQQVSGNSENTLALKTDGTVWGWGKNDNGQLGDGTRVDRASPIQVKGLGKTKQIAAGVGYSVALMDDGTVWEWGNRMRIADGNTAHCPPDGDCRFALTPLQIPVPTPIVRISAAGGTLALDASGQLWSFGGFWEGVSGDGSLENRLNLPVKVSIMGKVTAFSAGFGLALAVTQDGSVWAWGANYAGQLGSAPSGIDPTPRRIALPGPATGVAAGVGYSIVLLSDGRVMGFGNNSNGALGRGTFVADSNPDFMVSENGSGTFNVTTPAPTSLHQAPWITISALESRGPVPLTLNLTAKAGGNNGHKISRIEWASVDGSVSGQGENTTTILTKPGVMDIFAIATDDTGLRASARLTAVPMPSAKALRVAPQIAGIGIALAGLTETGNVWTWGARWHLGSQAFHDAALPGASIPTPLNPGISGIVRLTVSGATSYALTHVGDILAWGFNNYGELGSGHTVGWIFDPVLVTLSKPALQVAGSGTGNHTLALLADNSVWGWGGNSHGQLGLTDTASRNRPVQVPGLSNVVSVVASLRNSYAVDRDGALWAWGSNTSGQLGQGHTQATMGAVRVPGLPAVARVSAGDRSVIAVATDGRVFAWGMGNELPIGSLQIVSSPTQPPALVDFTDFVSGSIYTLGIKKDRTVWAWGENWANALIPGSTSFVQSEPIRIPGLEAPLSMTTSYNGGGAVLGDGTVVAWGINNYGQLGDGTYARRTTPGLVVNETTTGFLDLMPGIPKNIPLSLIPGFLVKATKLGSLSELTFSTKVFGLLEVPAAKSISTPVSNKPREATSVYNLYVAALSPNNSVASWYQLDEARNWGPMTWPMAQFLSGVVLNSNSDSILVQIIERLDASILAGTRIFVGYGKSAEEMLTAGRYRAVLTIE